MSKAFLPYYEIKKADVGRKTIRAFGKRRSLSDTLGTVLAIDVGKRMYLVDGLLGVENNEQRDARRSRR